MVTYELGNIADWVSAFGTITAVVVALYLARKDEKLRARVKAKNIHYVTPVNISPVVKISLEIVNTGKVPIHLKECTFKIGKFSNESMAFTDGSHNVNKLLNPREYYVHELEYKPIADYLRSKGIKKLKTKMFFVDSLDNT